eukprot:10989167-Alexandrium_andersonii.AAC.1
MSLKHVRHISGRAASWAAPPHCRETTGGSGDLAPGAASRRQRCTSRNCPRRPRAQQLRRVWLRSGAY